MKGARRRRLAILCVVVAVGACSPAAGDPTGSPSPGGPVPSATVSNTSGVGSAGCEKPPAPGSWSETLMHDGINRAYDFVVPETARGEAMPVVLSFHGFSLSSEDQAAITGLVERARVDGFVAVFPRGSDLHGMTSPYWNVETTDDPRLADDVGFTAAMLDRLEADLCVDRSRIFVSGWSNGGMFAATLGCALNDRVAAVASVSGVHLLADCPGRPMPIIVTHGSADPIVPLSDADVGPAAAVNRAVVLDNGGNAAQVRMAAAVAGTSVRSWVEAWARRNGCRLADPAVESGAGVETTAYRHCRAGGDVVLEVIVGGEHDWPPDATAHALSFFESHPLPLDQLS